MPNRKTQRPLLGIARVERRFPDNRLVDPCAELTRRLQLSLLAQGDLGGKRIAIPVGSRGIAELAGILSALVAFLKERGARPMIVPAMGSHGGATAEGQCKALAALGVTEQRVMAPILSSMDTVCLGEVQAEGTRWPVYLDRIAAESDGIVLMNRVKTHTDFGGPYGSGLVKMLAVGLGNEDAARVAHSRGTLGLRKAVPVIAGALLETGKVLAGIALVENACQHIAHIEVLPPSEILLREPELLKLAKEWMATLPINELDALIIGRMGKEISGTGIDTSVVGRLAIPGESDPPTPRITLIAVCDLTPASGGNALGMGIADFTVSRLARKVNRATTTRNVVATTFLERGKLPLVLPTDQALVETMVKLLEARGIPDPRMAFIRDTLSLSRFYATAPVIADLRGREDIRIQGDLFPVPFTQEGDLDLQW